MRIALDAMGSDQCPRPEIEGALAALREQSDLEIVLVGLPDILDKAVAAYNTAGLSISIEPASQVIVMADSPSKALKQKPDSSMVKCITLQKDKKVDASISAGNTGAFMAASLFGLGRIESVTRPAIGVEIPTVNGSCFCLDMGANADCRPQHLFQFARMGEIFVERVCGKSNPRVGLLNVGEEASKGGEVIVNTHAMLASSTMNFVGNVEGNSIIFDKADVLVCDGFLGNILLKFYEAIPKWLKHELGELLTDSRADAFKQKFNEETYGGADLLGINGVVSICHGKSTPLAIQNAIIKTTKMAETRINETIRQVLDRDPLLFN